MVHFQFITSESAAEFSEALAIYREAFPPEEQQPAEIIRNRIDAPQGCCIVGKMDEEVVAMSVLWHFGESEFTLLEYFAVGKEWRGKNIGSQFLEFLASAPQLRDRSIVAEVEDPAYGSNRTQRIKRMDFYFRNGFRMLEGVHSFVPPLSGDHPTEALLLVLAKSNITCYPKKELEQLIYKLYGEIYSSYEYNPLRMNILLKLPETSVLITKEEYFS